MNYWLSTSLVKLNSARLQRWALYGTVLSLWDVHFVIKHQWIFFYAAYCNFKTNAYCVKKTSMNKARVWSSLFVFSRQSLIVNRYKKERLDLSLFLKEQIALFALFKRAIRLRCLYKKSDLLSFAFLWKQSQKVWYKF